MPPHRRDARIRLAVELDAVALPVPVVDPAHERRDQRDAGVGAGDRLREAEQQREVAVDAVALEPLGRADAFPGGCDLDQHPVARDPRRLVQLDDAPAAGDGRVGIERRPRVDLGRYPARHDREDLGTEAHQQPVDQCLQRLAAMPRDGLVEQPAVLGLADRLEDQRRIGGRIAGRVRLHRVEVAGVGDHDGHRLQAFERVHVGPRRRRHGSRCVALARGRSCLPGCRHRPIIAPRRRSGRRNAD
jgi:hypothetical protein